MRSVAFLAVACLLAVAAAQPDISITVEIDGENIPLTVEGGISFVDAAAAFCDHYSLDKSLNVPRLAAALENQSARINTAKPAVAAPTPQVTLPLVVGNQNTELNYFEGQDPVTVVRQFAAQFQLTEDDANTVYRALVQELRLRQLPRIVATIQVDIDFGNGELRTVPMVVRENQSAQEAATIFANSHKLPESNIASLVNAINAELRPRPMFTMPLVVDGTPRELTLHENELPSDAATSFCTGFGIQAEECKKVRAAILARVQRIREAPAAPQPRAVPPQQQQVPQQRPRGVVAVTVGNQNFNVSFETGTTAAVLAESFCRQELGAVQNALNAAGSGSISLGDCVAVLTHELAARG